MDRTTLEGYLQIYPELNNGIARLESEIMELEAAEQRLNGILPNKYTESILVSVEAALESSRNDLRSIYEAKAKIAKSFSGLSVEQKRIIELRFWESQYSPRPWKEVAATLKYHPVYVQRLYKNALENIMHS